MTSVSNILWYIDQYPTSFTYKNNWLSLRTRCNHLVVIHESGKLYYDSGVLTKVGFINRFRLWFGVIRWEAKDQVRENNVMKKCGCVIRCLFCNDIQNDNAGHKILDENRHEYTCGWCGKIATVLFGIAPVPIWEEITDGPNDK